MPLPILVSVGDIVPALKEPLRISPAPKPAFEKSCTPAWIAVRGAAAVLATTASSHPKPIRAVISHPELSELQITYTGLTRIGFQGKGRGKGSAASKCARLDDVRFAAIDCMDATVSLGVKLPLPLPLPTAAFLDARFEEDRLDDFSDPLPDFKEGDRGGGA